MRTEPCEASAAAPSVLASDKKLRSPTGRTLGRRQPQVKWPNIADTGLTEGELLERRDGVGGSDANIILSGDRDRVERLWREKKGLCEPEDLSRSLPVRLGSWTEAFNRQWFERSSGQSISRVGQVLVCPVHSWRRCTLDGYVAGSGAVWEAKHVSAFAKEDDVLARYMPQLQHNMAVARSQNAILSVIYGNHSWHVYEIAADWLYAEELLAAESQFWNCVVNSFSPSPALVPAPPKPIGCREVCLEGNNLWAAAADDWRQNWKAARIHASAASALKGLVESDVTRAFGHGVEVKRSKAGALSIKEGGQ